VWGTTTIEVGTWYHLAGVHDTSSNELKLYLDGVLESTITPTIGSIHSGPADFRIGAREYPGAQCYFNGVIDEVRIWDKALRPCEVQLAMDGQLEILLDAGIVIYTSSVHNVEVGPSAATVNIQIVPDDRTNTIRSTDTWIIHRVTPKKKNQATTEILVIDQTCYNLEIRITSAPSRAKTIHLWVYLSNGEHVPVNLHIGH
jgi:hypothetical protein